MAAHKITFFMLTSLCQLEFINNAVQLITTLKKASSMKMTTLIENVCL